MEYKLLIILIVVNYVKGENYKCHPYDCYYDCCDKNDLCAVSPDECVRYDAHYHDQKVKPHEESKYDMYYGYETQWTIDSTGKKVFAFEKELEEEFAEQQGKLHE